MSFNSWTCKNRMALYNFYRKVTCESSTLTQKDLEKSQVREAVESTFSNNGFPYSCICDGLEHHSLVETLPWLWLQSLHFSRTTCRLPPYKTRWQKKLCDCQSPNLNSPVFIFGCLKAIWLFPPNFPAGRVRVAKVSMHEEIFGYFQEV